ncbi:OmpA family protein [Verrucomicrobiales bacterium BCK34]|nr:OmpA family protein [Verrucomicrobiales bacterium BCK34]
MKVFANIALLLILLALLGLAVTVPRQWANREDRDAAEDEKATFVLSGQPEAAPVEPDQAGPDEEVEQTPEKKPDETPPSEILAILSKLQGGESEEAAILINEALEKLSEEDAITLQSIVVAEKARAEQFESLAAQLNESKKELAAVEKSSREALDESLRTLAIATRRAEDATAESKKLTRQLEEKAQEEIAAAKAGKPAERPPEKAIKLPEKDLIDFSFGSTYLNDANKETLSKTIKILKERSELDVQLRGHTDTIGEPEYNAALALARCEMTRDFLIEQGIENHRISIVSFGESQVFKEGVVAEKPRRVEILFRPGPGPTRTSRKVEAATR